MGRYAPGDVVLADIPMGRACKVRPAVVVSAGEDGTLEVVPLSSRAPADTRSTPIALEDFVEGGLDIFGTSYALTAYPSTIRASAIRGRKGRLTAEALAGIRGPAGKRRG
ncbi:MAG: type II toxin-antitoxin system PemK/MazF family toxin [Methanomicrobiales archaeon]|nr:type II toxin-antitoxin system PemK/MazF family toxin [Methanomicrobiales archaeon]